MTLMMPQQPTTPPTPPSPTTEGDRRIVPIFANLMPAEVVESRRGRQARRLVLAALIALVVLLGGGYAFAVVQTELAESELVDAQDQALSLKRQQAQYAEVVRTRAQSAQIEKQLTELMTDDMRWSKVLSGIRGAAPAGVKLESVAGVLTPKQQGTQPEAADEKLPSTSKSKAVGTLAITGVGPSKTVIAAYVDAVGKLPGVADPYLGSVTEEQKGVLSFSLRLTITADALGGRFADSGKKAGGN